MKATGIVRRIDELGRVVIPKEIRRTLRIREGDPLEIFTDREGQVILKKYSPIDELGDFAKEYTEALSLSTGHIAIVCDKDMVVATAGCRAKDFMDKSVSEAVEQIMKNREKLVLNRIRGDKPLDVLASYEDETVTAQVIVPIIASGDAIGAVMLLSREENMQMSEIELKVCEIAANFLGKQMED